MEQFARTNFPVARIETTGRSREEKGIRAVLDIDSAHPDKNKENFLVIIARHGDELGTRTVGPSLLEWLASAEATLADKMLL